MDNAQYFADEEIGLTRNEIRFAAKRMLLASMVAALVVAVGALSLAFISTSHDYARVAPHRFALAQQPIFVNQGAVATKQAEIELP